MSYAICHVICGYAVPEALLERDEDFPDLCECFENFYSGSSIDVCYCGVEVYSFDECASPQRIADFIPKLTATAAQVEQAREKMAEAVERVREYAQEMKISPDEILGLLPTEPDLIMLWGSS